MMAKQRTSSVYQRNAFAPGLLAAAVLKARTTPDGVHVEYAGLARGEDPALARAVDEFATRHAHALGVDQPAKDTP